MSVLISNMSMSLMVIQCTFIQDCAVIRKGLILEGKGRNIGTRGHTRYKHAHV